MQVVVKKIRNIPIHLIALNAGQSICQSIVSVHHLSGSGTKHSAMKADLSKYLLEFGRGEFTKKSTLITYFFINFFDHRYFWSTNWSMYERSWNYLVKVFNKTSRHESFDDLRNHHYYYSAKCTLKELPLTSTSIHLHIWQAFLATYIQLHCLESSIQQLDPQNFGYTLDDGIHVRTKNSTLLPPMNEFVPPWTCTNCSRSTYRCVVAQIPCCVYCNCYKNSENCRNINNYT